MSSYTACIVGLVSFPGPIPQIFLYHDPSSMTGEWSLEIRIYKANITLCRRKQGLLGQIMVNDWRAKL